MTGEEAGKVPDNKSAAALLRARMTGKRSASDPAPAADAAAAGADAAGGGGSEGSKRVRSTGAQDVADAAPAATLVGEDGAARAMSTDEPAAVALATADGSGPMDATAATDGANGQGEDAPMQDGEPLEPGTFCMSVRCIAHPCFSYLHIVGVYVCVYMCLYVLPSQVL